MASPSCTASNIFSNISKLNLQAHIIYAALIVTQSIVASVRLVAYRVRKSTKNILQNL